MEINIYLTILGGFLASVAWFIIGGALYLNPVVAKIYKKFDGSPGVKKWKSTKVYLLNMYFFGALLQCLLFAFVYSFIKPALTESLPLNVLFFGMILVAIKIIPRLFDMWIQTVYPDKLLTVELVNGIIGSFVMALVLALVI